MTFNLKTITPAAPVPDGALFFGAGSQSDAAPTLYAASTLRDKLFGASGWSGATVAASAPLLNQSQTWNNAAVTFGAWVLDVTDTASAAASKLLDLQVGGSSRFSVRKDGLVTAASGAITVMTIGSATITPTIRASGTSGVTLQNSAVSAAATLVPDAHHILAQRSGANAQTARWYETYADVSNNAGIEIVTQTGDALIRTFGNGTGTKRNIVIDGANRAAHIADPTGGATTDAEARTAINAILVALENHGLVATA